MRYCALLRAVNVGGRKVAMKELRAAAEALGFSDVRTLIASGNLVFETGKTAPAKLETKLETAIQETFGLFSEVMIRTPAELADIIQHNPFPGEAATAPSSLVAILFKTDIDVAAVMTYLKTYPGPERVRLDGRTAYVFYPEGQGRSKLKFPARSGVGTARNWNTVLKLAEMLGV